MNLEFLAIWRKIWVTGSTYKEGADKYARISVETSEEFHTLDKDNSKTGTPAFESRWSSCISAALEMIIKFSLVDDNIIQTF